MKKLNVILLLLVFASSLFGLDFPKIGDIVVNVVSPSIVELTLVSGADYKTPDTNNLKVRVDGLQIAINSFGLKRRAAYAPLQNYDLRVETKVYMQLSREIQNGSAVEVFGLDNHSYYSKKLDNQFSPVIHVNQEGYAPNLQKKAMVGYYLGNMGEMKISVDSFSIVNAVDDSEVYTGKLFPRFDFGFNVNPLPYQSVLEADFTQFKTIGEYKIKIKGYGESYPFVINDGVPMGFLRTYALGLYHQRCGVRNELPFTRFVHDFCHIAPVQVPNNGSEFDFTWSTIERYSSEISVDNPKQSAPFLTRNSQLYPFIRTGKIDVSGGHHDAGDYSKYIINSATLVHYLTFTSDSISGASLMDNLGLPESGDGISDILQEAKIEADFISKMQDSDGGFYFLVYPKNREYESGALPDQGDNQVVWPKNTAGTAASVAALAQISSSPEFKKNFPNESKKYLIQAKLGWDFLMNAIDKHGKAGAYQKITFYGDHWTHDDELAWASCEMYLATGDPKYQQKLFEFFPDPSDSSTFRWGWWRMSESWGNCIRSYAFAVKSGRLDSSKLDKDYLRKCEEQIKLAGEDALRWSNQSAYGTSFPEPTKRVYSAGWYFSLDQASDMAVANQLSPKDDYTNGLISNMNYEGGTNPVNVVYLTGLGNKRQREIVNQYAQNDRRVLPPTGVPIGNIQSSFDYLQLYGFSLTNASYPDEQYPLYDRWTDTFNVTTEFVSVNQARSIMSLASIVAVTNYTQTPWKSGKINIIFPKETVELNEPVEIKISGDDLAGAKIVWEGKDQSPLFGSSFPFVPKNSGEQWVETEVEWPDGRRAFATNKFNADSPVVYWVNGSVPNGGLKGISGGETWNWSGVVHPYPLNISSELHEHWFSDATDSMHINPGDILFAWVYVDGQFPTKELMLSFNNGSWDHRVYWGDNLITYGTTNTQSRFYSGPLPKYNNWTMIAVAAEQIGLENTNVTGMSFSTLGGNVYWAMAGKFSTK